MNQLANVAMNQMPPQGMPQQGLGMAQPMQSQPVQGGHFNGVVSVQGSPVEVKNGQAIVDGEKFIVSDDGKLVVNQQRQFVGIIQNGKFIQSTPELINQLSKQGVFESEQPQGVAAQTPR